MMARLKKIGSSDWTLLFLSALLSALPLDFPGLFLLSWVSYVPFFFVMLRNSGRGSWVSAALRGLFFGFSFYFFLYDWFLSLYPLDFAGLTSGEGIAVVLAGWLGISFLHGVLFVIPTLLGHVLSRFVSSKPLICAVTAFGILTAEKICSLSQLAFPWIRVSLGQYRAPVLFQSLSVWGVDGLDLLILSVSAALTLVLCLREKKRILSATVAASLFLGNLAFGAVRLTGEETGESISVLAVQGCILSGEKWDGSTSAYETYYDLTRENTTPEIDLVVWPESAVAVNLSAASSYQESYQKLSRAIDAPIFMGCFWSLDGTTSNSAVLLDGETISPVYSKRHLVPFGECLPYREFVSDAFPMLEKINMLSSDLAVGTSSVVMNGEKGNYGALICFESIFPSLCAQSVRDGAELFVLVTNDSWYKDSAGVYQHLAHGIFRSVENGRATVRCANSGVSALIDARGRVLEELGPLEQGLVQGSVSFSEEETLYTAWGDWLYGTYSVMLLLGCGLSILWERRKRV